MPLRNCRPCTSSYARAAATLSPEVLSSPCGRSRRGDAEGHRRTDLFGASLVGGPTVLDNDDIWRVAELHMDETPPVAVVERAERGASPAAPPLDERGNRRTAPKIRTPGGLSLLSRGWLHAKAAKWAVTRPLTLSNRGGVSTRCAR